MGSTPSPKVPGFFLGLLGLLGLLALMVLLREGIQLRSRATPIGTMQGSAPTENTSEGSCVHA